MTLGDRVLIPTLWPTPSGFETKLLPGVISSVWGQLVFVKVDGGYSYVTNLSKLQLLEEVTKIIEFPKNGVLMSGGKDAG